MTQNARAVVRGVLTAQDEGELAHFAEPFWSGERQPFGQWDSVPYDRLDGAAFERLCFHLLLADGQYPRFFGASGTADYGVDLLCSDGRSCFVYQCKNVARFSPAAFQKWLNEFEREWLVERAGSLPRPNTFFVFWPIVANQREELEEIRTDWAIRTGVGVQIISREIIDARLKQLPDVVADLFGDDAAERFCGVDDWNQGLFLPLVRGTGERRIVDHFLNLESAGQIIRDATLCEQFTEILGQHRFVVFLGRSGSGKTITALDLARGLGMPQRRIYVLHRWHDAHTDAIVNGIKARATRPTIFLIDDVHDDLGKVANVVERALIVCKDRPIELILTARQISREFEEVSESDREFVEQCLIDGQVIELEPGPALIRELVERVQPALTGISRERLERLIAETAGDLVLVRQALRTISVAEDIDSLDRTVMLDRMRKRYFPNPRVDTALERLAAIAQFDIRVPWNSLERPPDVERNPQLRRLIFMDGIPEAWRFVHSSLAELAFRALCQIRGEASPERAAARHLAAHLRSAPTPNGFYWTDLSTILNARLSVSDTRAIKEALLAESAVVEQLTSPDFGDLRTVGNAAVLAQSQPVGAVYRAALVAGIASAERGEGRAELRALPGLLRQLRMVDPACADDLEQRLDVSNWLDSGTLMDLMRVLRRVAPSLASTLVGGLQAASVCGLIDRTIMSRQSIKTLNLLFWKFGAMSLPSGQSLSRALEERIGAAEMLRLIEAVGTVVDLLQLLGKSSREFASSIICLLQGDRILTMVDRAIETAQPIGTLPVLLRVLGTRQHSDELTQADAFERALGAANLLRLIEASGTLVDLIRLLPHCSSEIVTSLIAELDPVRAQALLDRAIRTSRSIGTIDVAMRHCERIMLPGGSTVVEAIEKMIGTAGALRLIDSNGTLPDLIKFIGTSSPAFAADVIAELDSERMRVFVARTISAGRSVGSIGIAFRELRSKKFANGTSYLNAFEQKLSAAEAARLLQRKGTLPDLMRVLQYASPAFAAALIGELAPELVRRLIDRAVAARRSVGTVDLALRDLARRQHTDGRTLLEDFEKKVGSAEMLRLVEANGTVVELFRILAKSSPTFGFQLAAALDSKRMRALVDRAIAGKTPIGSIGWSIRALLRDAPKTLDAVNMLVGADGWLRMARSIGNLDDIAFILDAQSAQCRGELLGALDMLATEDWEGLALAGDFSALSRFARDAIPMLMPSTGARVALAIIARSQEVVQTSSWLALAAGMRVLDEARGSTLAPALQSAVRARLDRTNVDELQFPNLVDASCFLNLIRFHHPEHVARVASRLWTLLPREPRWRAERALLVASRSVLEFCRDPLVTPEDAERAVRAVAPLPDVVRLEKQETSDLFGFLWSLWALWVQRGGPPNFETLQLPGFWERTMVLLGERMRRKAPIPERLNRLQLAGIIAFCVPSLRSAAHTAVDGNVGYVPRLLDEIDKLTFVPAFFAGQGLAVIHPPNRIFTRFRCDSLIEKQKELVDNGSATAQLVRWLETERSRLAEPMFPLSGWS